MEDKALGLLGLMRRAGAVEIGTDSACDAVHAGKARLLILSADIADNALRKAENAANGRRVLVLPVHYTRAGACGMLHGGGDGDRLCRGLRKGPRSRIARALRRHGRGAPQTAGEERAAQKRES